MRRQGAFDHEYVFGSKLALISDQGFSKQIVKEIPTAKVEAMELDLNSMASVRKFASDYNSSGQSLNLLIKSRQSKKEGRIVNLSSEAHRLTYPEGIRFDKINDEKQYINIKQYGQSKQANIQHANQLTKHLTRYQFCFRNERATEITANSLHPGVISTNLFRHIFTPPKFAEVVDPGAATTCYVALHPQVKGVSGEYFSDSNLAKTTKLAKDMDLAKRLWDFSIDLIK
ncbi:short-chain dehydrogenase TIC 32, chloroplastic-like protein [Tanacetum coccineum]